jgi:hypothetical protein
MAAGLQWETAAFAYEEHDFSDVELVFVQKQPHRVVEQMEEVQQQQPERGTAIKRRREGGSLCNAGFRVVVFAVCLTKSVSFFFFFFLYHSRLFP